MILGELQVSFWHHGEQGGRSELLDNDTTNFPFTSFLKSLLSLRLDSLWRCFDIFLIRVELCEKELVECRKSNKHTHRSLSWCFRHVRHRSSTCFLQFCHSFYDSVLRRSGKQSIVRHVFMRIPSVRNDSKLFVALEHLLCACQPWTYNTAFVQHLSGVNKHKRETMAGNIKKL